MSITPEQREQRRKYLGSSDMPVIMNVSPYKNTPQDIYYSKVADELPDEPTESMGIGNWLEGPLIEWASETLGLEVDTDPANLFKVATEGDGAGLLAANNDALVLGRAVGIEAKFVSGELAKAYGEPRTDHVPDHVIVQTQHQMYCSDLEMVYVAMATPSYYGVERRIYHVHRDEGLIAELIKYGVEWWQKHIPSKTPPNPDEAPPMYVIKSLRREVGKVVELGEAGTDMVIDYEEAKADEKLAKSKKESKKAEILFTLGDAEIGKLPDGRRITYEAHDTNRFDTKGFQAHDPETAAKWIKKTSSRTMYIRKK